MPLSTTSGCVMGNGEVNIKSLSGGLQSILLFLSILAIVVPCTFGFVNLDRRIDVNLNKQEEHVNKDEIKWSAVETNIDELEDGQHALEMANAVSEAHYQAILAEMSEVKAQLRTVLLILQDFEVTP
jgi:hypothetical protein